MFKLWLYSFFLNSKNIFSLVWIALSSKSHAFCMWLTMVSFYWLRNAKKRNYLKFISFTIQNEWKCFCVFYFDVNKKCRQIKEYKMLHKRTTFYYCKKSISLNRFSLFILTAYHSFEKTLNFCALNPMIHSFQWTNHRHSIPVVIIKR